MVGTHDHSQCEVTVNREKGPEDVDFGPRGADEESSPGRRAGSRWAGTRGGIVAFLGKKVRRGQLALHWISIEGNQMVEGPGFDCFGGGELRQGEGEERWVNPNVVRGELRCMRIRNRKLFLFGVEIIW